MSAPRFPTANTGDGATKSFALGFPVIAESHIRVLVAGALKVRGTDYVVQDPTAKNPTIVFTNAPANAAAIKFYRNTPLTPDTAKTLVIGPTEALYAQYRAEEQSDRRIRLPYYINATDLSAGTAQQIVAPCDGYVEKLETDVSDAAIVTGGAVTVEVEGTAVTGLSIAVANSAAIGVHQEDTPTTPQSTTTKVYRGQVITVTPAAAFNGGGALKGHIEIQPADLG